MTSTNGRNRNGPLVLFLENALSLLSKHHDKKLPVVNGAGRNSGHH
jgi:hypothetical protein